MNVDPDLLAERIADAWELRAAGRSVREVARALGVAVSTAHDYLRKAAAADASVGLDVNAERRRDLATVDRWLARCDDAGRVEGEPVHALATAVTGLLRHRSRLLGTDVRARTEVTANLGHAPAVADALARRRAEREQREREQIERDRAHRVLATAVTLGDVAQGDRGGAGGGYAS